MRRPLVLLLLAGCTFWGAEAAEAAPDPWSAVPRILESIHVPSFPPRDLPVTSFGAVGDGKTDCTGAFRRAIEACHRAGGGRVVVSPGRYLTGAIHLKSGVNLHVATGTTVAFYQDPSRYLPAVLTRYEGNDCWNYSPFIYARDQQNVAITGSGTIDGRGDAAVWKQMDRSPADPERLRSMAEKGVPVEKRVFGSGHSLRPNLVQFYGCRGVLVEGVTLRNGPMWTLHPVLSESVTVRGITVESEVPNGDGIDPESCRRVSIQDCTFRTRDDAIAIKSGRNADGRRLARPAEDIVIRNCRILPAKKARNGIAIGSEVSGGARNVFIEDCTIAGRLRGISLKTNSRRGGLISGVYLRNLQFRNLEGPVLSVDMNYGSETGGHPPRIRDVELRNARVDGALSVWELDIPRPNSLTNLAIVDSQFYGIREETEAHGGLPGAALVRSTVDGEPAVIGPTPLRAQFRSLVQDHLWKLVLAAFGLALLGILGVRRRLRAHAPAS